MMNMFDDPVHSRTSIGYLSCLVKAVRKQMHNLRARPFDGCAIDRTDNTIVFYWKNHDAAELQESAPLSRIYNHNGTLTTSSSIDQFTSDMAQRPRAVAVGLLNGLMQQGFPIGQTCEEYPLVAGETENTFPIGINTYENMAERVACMGVRRENRTGTDVFGVFSEDMVFDLRDGFPLVTTKKVHMKSIAAELIWFLRGSDNTKWLKENGVSIWDEWAKEDGSLGPVYGVQWRRWTSWEMTDLVEMPEGADPQKLGTVTAGILERKEVDQIGELIQKLKSNPMDRRLIVSAWNVGALSRMALPPCHAFFQFYVEEQPIPILHCKLYQRSADVFLGVPFNIASYALLMTIIARQVGMVPGCFHWTGGDTHIYENHAHKLGMQLQRMPRALPVLEVRRADVPDDVGQYEIADFVVKDYDPHPAISAPVAV